MRVRVGLSFEFVILSSNTFCYVTVVVDEADANEWVDVEGASCCLCASKEVVRTVSF